MTVKLCILLFMTVAAGTSWPQTSASGTGPGMQASLAQQRQSIELQLRSLASSSFFTLPPPFPIGGPQPPETACEPVPAEQLTRMIDEAAKTEAVAADLLHSVVRQESGARPCAVSAKGAQGLMQLMPATSRQFGVTDPFDVKQNLRAGARYLKQLLVRYDGDISKALAAYNAGPARVDQTDSVPPIPETMRYVSSILSTLPH